MTLSLTCMLPLFCMIYINIILFSHQLHLFLQTGYCAQCCTIIFDILSLSCCFNDFFSWSFSFSCPQGKSTLWSAGWLEAKVKGITLGCRNTGGAWSQEGSLGWRWPNASSPETAEGAIKIHYPCFNRLLTCHGAKKPCVIPRGCLEGKESNNLALPLVCFWNTAWCLCRLLSYRNLRCQGGEFLRNFIVDMLWPKTFQSITSVQSELHSWCSSQQN